MEKDNQSTKIVQMLSHQELPKKMYGLFFLKPRTVTDLSVSIYGKKRELSQISRVMKKFQKYDIIIDYFLTKQELKQKGLDPRLHFWRGTGIPLFHYWNDTLKLRKTSAKKPSSNYLFDKKDKEVLELLLSSKWFKNIILEKYEFKYNKKELENKFYLNVLDSITGAIGDIGAISLAYHMSKVGTKVSNDKIINDGSFDNFIANENKQLNDATKKRVKDILENALDYLGVKKWPYIRSYYDLVLKDSAPIFIPFGLAKKIAGLGRIETTLLVAFDNRGFNERPY
jgi:hypothetical protein